MSGSLIEGLRRLEIPVDMQKKFGFVPLGAADGPVKTAIFGGNNARLYGVNPIKAGMELSKDRFSVMKTEYEKNGPEPSNVRYGYVQGPLDHAGLHRSDGATPMRRAALSRIVSLYGKSTSVRLRERPHRGGCGDARGSHLAAIHAAAASSSSARTSPSLRPVEAGTWNA